MSNRLKFLTAILVLLISFVVADRILFVDNVIILSERTNESDKQTTINPRNTNPTTIALLPPANEFNEIWKRPLFTENRQANAIAVTPRTRYAPLNSATSDQPPPFTVIGVAISPDGGSVIIKKSRNELLRALVGDEIDGWRIDELDPKSVTMSKNGERWQLPIGTR